MTKQKPVPIDVRTTTQAKRSPDCADAKSKPPPTVTQQIYEQMRSEGMAHGYFCEQPLRHHANYPLDQLLRPVEKEAKDAKPRKPDKSGED
jgi:hypothetical protein